MLEQGALLVLTNFCVCLQKYLQPLKSPENAGLVDAAAVDAMFYQVVKYNWHNWENIGGISEHIQGCLQE